MVVDKAFAHIPCERDAANSRSRLQVLRLFVGEVNGDVIFYSSRKFLLIGRGACAAMWVGGSSGAFIGGAAPSGFELFGVTVFSEVPSQSGIAGIGSARGFEGRIAMRGMRDFRM